MNQQSYRRLRATFHLISGALRALRGPDPITRITGAADVLDGVLYLREAAHGDGRSLPVPQNLTYAMFGNSASRELDDGLVRLRGEILAGPGVRVLNDAGHLIWTGTGTEAEALALVRDEFWRRFPRGAAIIPVGSDAYDQRISIEPRAAETWIRDELVTEIEDYVRRARAKQVPAQVLLVGPRGTGKSAAIAAVTSAIPRALFLRGDLQSALAIARFLEPGVLVLDEFEKMVASSDGLTPSDLDDTLAVIGIVLAAANEPDTIDAGYTRPGRFDRRIDVGRASDILFESLARDIPGAYHDRIRDWPAAWIRALSRRRELYGDDELAGHVDQLGATLVKDAEPAVPD